MRALLALALLLTVDDFQDGFRAYEEERFGDALAHFDAAIGASSGQPSVALLHNRTLAALLAGELTQAEATADRVVEVGGDEWTSWRDFVRGNTAFARCERAAVLADQPEAEPFLFDTAIAAAVAARDAWRSALLARDHWPAARRNLERALWKLQELQRRKAEAEQRAAQQEPPPPEPDPEEEGDRTEESADLAAQRSELSAEEVARLFQRLEEKKEERRELRRRYRQRPDTAVERDW